uniref:Uncharacterized protein n=1 Tax=Fagus sylvatica TaxID=28930 RepID=A0A2N9I308_FAGSY
MIGDTALHVAAKFGKLDIIKVLTVEFGKRRHADDFVNKQLLRIKNQIGNTALHVAVITQNLNEVKYLVSIDPEVAYYLNEEKISPFYLAVETKNKEILKALLEEARDLDDVERPRPRGESPIYAIILRRNKACKNGHVDIVNELLEQQWPNPTEFLNNEGQNILHIAAKCGKYVVVRNLLRNPKLEMFVINAKDNLGNTALHLASMNLHPNVVCSLTWEDKEDKRVDLELRNNDGLTAIDVVADRGSWPPSTLREV